MFSLIIFMETFDFNVQYKQSTFFSGWNKDTFTVQIRWQAPHINILNPENVIMRT